jgi:hypothetical protein
VACSAPPAIIQAEYLLLSQVASIAPICRTHLR